MTWKINVRDFTRGTFEAPPILVNTADTVSFLVANWPDSQTPCFTVPDGKFIVGFRIDLMEFEITVYLGTGRIV